MIQVWDAVKQSTHPHHAPREIFSQILLHRIPFQRGQLVILLGEDRLITLFLAVGALAVLHATGATEVEHAAKACRAAIFGLAKEEVNGVRRAVEGKARVF